MEKNQKGWGAIWVCISCECNGGLVFYKQLGSQMIAEVLVLWNFMFFTGKYIYMNRVRATWFIFWSITLLKQVNLQNQPQINSKQIALNVDLKRNIKCLVLVKGPWVCIWVWAQITNVDECISRITNVSSKKHVSCNRVTVMWHKHGNCHLSQT